MNGYISVKNLSRYPIITVYVDDILYFYDLLSESAYKPCVPGSTNIKILDNREKVVYDLYLPINPGCRYLLEIYHNSYAFIQSGFS